MEGFHTGRETVRIGDREVRFPYPAKHNQGFDGVEVFVLDTGDGMVDHVPDFVLPAPGHDPDPESPPGRNVVGIDASGEHLWTVGADPEVDGTPVYGEVFRFLDRCLCRRSDEGFVELDVETGAVVERFPEDALRVGGNLVEFDHRIGRIQTGAGVGLLVLSTDVDRDHDASDPVVAYDFEGDRLWRRVFFDPWWLSFRDGRIVEGYELGMGCYVEVAHDPATGEAVAIDDAFTDDPDVLEGYVPERYYPLVEEYADRGDR